MIKKGKKACDWCGKTFRKDTKYIEYEGGQCYHHKCAKSLMAEHRRRMGMR